MWFQRIFRRNKGEHSRYLGGDFRDLPQSKMQLSSSALRQLNRLQLTANRYMPGSSVGLRSSLRRKPAYDFREHRMYVPGDDVRFVDWKASARQEHIFIKQGEEPKEVSVYLLIDCSASMRWGEPPKANTLLDLAAALGYLALAHSDRLVIYPSPNPKIRPLGPVSGKGQVPTLLNYLKTIPFDGRADFSEAVKGFTRRNRGGLTLVLSDLLDVKRFSNALALLPAPTWDVVVFHLLHPQELEPTLKGDYQMVDIETGRSVNYDVDDTALRMYREKIETWRNDLERSCIENNAFYSLIPTHWSLEREIIPYLRSVQIVSSL
jgi:uncharacterized protein (DUF58 family)